MRLRAPTRWVPKKGQRRRPVGGISQGDGGKIQGAAGAAGVGTAGARGSSCASVQGTATPDGTAERRCYESSPRFPAVPVKRRPADAQRARDRLYALSSFVSGIKCCLRVRKLVLASTSSIGRPRRLRRARLRGGHTGAGSFGDPRTARTRQARPSHERAACRLPSSCRSLPTSTGIRRPVRRASAPPRSDAQE